MTDRSGPAFPVSNLSEVAPQGMSLRDWFASQERTQPRIAMNKITENEGDYEELAAMMAKWRYQVADAMLKAREVVSNES